MAVSLLMGMDSTCKYEVLCPKVKPREEVEPRAKFGGWRLNFGGHAWQNRDKTNPPKFLRMGAMFE
jgi:hypothetical protein